MRDFLIAGNWKMNSDIRSGASLVGELIEKLSTIERSGGVHAAICPPFPMIDTAGAMVKGSNLFVGAQNMHFENDGAFTGEVSASMLAALGCTYVIVGHSERRQYFGETDAIVNKKALKAIEKGLKPIICIGETIEERDSGKMKSVIEKQVRSVLVGFDEVLLENSVFAYEPVWAIGTGKTATPEQAQEVHAHIRSLVSERISVTAAEKLLIQYGGSMKPENAFNLLSKLDVDGGLIGGASLNANQFVKIVAEAERVCSLGGKN